MINRHKARLFFFITVLSFYSIWRSVMMPWGIDWHWIKRVLAGYFGFILISIWDLSRDDQTKN